MGGGLEADVLEQAPADPGFSAFAEASAKIPFVGAKVGGEFDLICGTGKGKLGANFGPLQFGGDGGDTGGSSLGGGIDRSSDSWLEALAGAPKAKVEGKAGFKACLGTPPS